MISIDPMHIILLLFSLGFFVFSSHHMFKMTEKLLHSAKKTFWQYAIFTLINFSIFFVISLVFFFTPFKVYFIIGIVFFIEFQFVFKQHFRDTLFVLGAYLLHIGVIYNIVSAIFTANVGFPINMAARLPNLVFLSVSITVLVLAVTLELMRKFFPFEKVRIIINHQEQRLLLEIWMGACVFYLIFNALLYETNINTYFFSTDQIIKNFVLLAGTYLILHYSFIACGLLHYGEKHKDLQNKANFQSKFFSALTQKAVLNLEINLTQDRVIRGMEIYGKEFIEAKARYSDTMPLIIKDLVHTDDVNEFLEKADRQRLLQIFKKGITKDQIDYRRKNGTTFRWMHLEIKLIEDAKNGDIRAHVHAVDIDSEKKEYDDLKEKSERDLLTGLYNKKTTEILISKQLKNTSGVLFLIDLDDFKMINDYMGHTTGDQFLRSFSGKLQKIFRDDDIVGRIGGDEFLVFMHNTLSHGIIVQRAKQIMQKAFSEFTDSKGIVHRISASIGICLVQKNISFNTAYKHADLAMYAAKKAGKNLFAFYDGQEQSHYISKRDL